MALFTGLERLAGDDLLLRALRGRRVALLAHPASTVGAGILQGVAPLTHAIDVLRACAGVNLVAAFGPQHGVLGDQQDNMRETPDTVDMRRGRLPVYSLYGDVRRPTAAMMDSFDVLLVDLQDLGCRIYTFITTLRYVLEEAARYGKSVWILDRPNPLGRRVEGLTLRAGWESFVGAGSFPMRHGLTMGELARYFVSALRLDVDLRVVMMEGYEAARGWPHDGSRVWINPSPNAPSLFMARAYAGTVMLEGTTLSEGRGTTHPLEIVGAPSVVAEDLLQWMLNAAPDWTEGCTLRPCWFMPTFHKHAGELCGGLHIHTEEAAGFDDEHFRPWRLVALMLKGVRTLYPDVPLWRGRDFVYEYETERMAIDVINGSPLLREWVDDPRATPADLDALARMDERAWEQIRADYLSYS